MTSPVDKRRPHDSEASRQALLAAAAPLFEERGFEAVTVRQIGERAQVDPALIVRYFGGKEGLYLAVMSEAGGVAPSDVGAIAFAERLLLRQEVRGIGPVSRGAVSATLSDAMRDSVQQILDARAVVPIAAPLRERDLPDAELRAALVVAMSLGVSLVRAGGALPALSDATAEQVLELLGPAIDAVTREAR